MLIARRQLDSVRQVHTQKSSSVTSQLSRSPPHVRCLQFHVRVRSIQQYPHFHLHRYLITWYDPFAFNGYLARLQLKLDEPIPGPPLAISTPPGFSQMELTSFFSQHATSSHSMPTSLETIVASWQLKLDEHIWRPRTSLPHPLAAANVIFKVAKWRRYTHVSSGSGSGSSESRALRT